jgi:Concanavalin A-like lectin/glucanases superfamily/Carboxypeptidase regulatory-like domain
MTNPTESLQPVLALNGQENAINLGKKPQFKIEKEITLEAWIYVTSQKAYAGIISNIYDTGSTESGYGLLLDGSSGIYFGLKLPSVGMQYLSSGANTIILNRWHHIAGTYDGKEMKVYVDGIEKAKQAWAGTSINYSPENDLSLGMYKDNDEVYAFPGKLAEIRLWKITRTQPEIQNNLYWRLAGNESGLVGYWPLNEGRNNIVHDLTSNANHGVINGANWEQSKVPFTISSLQPILGFNGQENAINLGKKPQFKIEKEITLEAWIYVTSQKAYAGIISNIYDTGSTESGYGLLLDGNSGIYFGLKLPSVGIQYLSSGANTIILNRWHHIAGTYDGKEMKVYVDGIEKAKQAWAGTNINYNPENDLLLGMYKDNDEVYAFPGKLAEIRLWKITRTQPEIQNNLYRRLAGNESGLVGYWPLNEGRNNIVHDLTSNANHGTFQGNATWVESEVPLSAVAPLAAVPPQPIPETNTGTKPPIAPLAAVPPQPIPETNIGTKPPIAPLAAVPPQPIPETNIGTKPPIAPLAAVPPQPIPETNIGTKPPVPPSAVPTQPIPETNIGTKPPVPPSAVPTQPIPETNTGTKPPIAPLAAVPPQPIPETNIGTKPPAPPQLIPEEDNTGTESEVPLETTSWIELEPVRHQVAIYGQISDAETGLTIQGALVEIVQMPETFRNWLALRSQQYGSKWQTLEHRPDRKRTAIDGYFHFLDLPDGEYTFTASLPSAGTCYGTAEVKAIASRDSQDNYVKTAANMTLPPTAIKGKITDSDGTPIVLARIQIAGTTDYIFSDNKGNYLFSSLETSQPPLKRRVNVNVSARGFQPATQSVELSQGEVQNLNVVLTSS